MLDKSLVFELKALAEKNAICSEGNDLLERCLADRSTSSFEEFIQDQMLTNPASIDVLQDLAETVHQQMIALQEALFDIRSDVLQSLKNLFQIDLIHLAPADLVEEYHRLELDEALAFVAQRYPQLTDDDLVKVCHILHNSAQGAGHIMGSIVLVRQILNYIFDWIEALGINTVHMYWNFNQAQPPDILLH